MNDAITASSPPIRTTAFQRRAACFLLLFLACLCQSKAAPPKSPIVVIISLDGVGAFYLDDPKSDIPTLHQIMAEGASAKRMKGVLPTSTWPNHTSMITGVNPARHGVVGNKFWDRQQGKSIPLIADPIFLKDEIVKVPTLYDAAHAAGLQTLAILWPATRGAKTLGWTVPDTDTDEHFQKFGTPELLEDCRKQGLPIDKHQAWREAGNDEPRDLLYTQMFLYGLEHYHPQLALLHLINVDHVQHGHAPRSPEAYHALHFADQRVKDVRDLLEAKYPGQYTLIVTSDHGFASTRQQIHPNVKFRQAGLLTVKGTKVATRHVFAISQGGSAFIYILDQPNRAELLARVLPMFEGTEGIDRIIGPKEYKSFGLANPETNPWMADMVITAKNGYSFAEEAVGDVLVTPRSETAKGVHGHSPLLPDLYACFMACGKNIKKGAKLDEINNLDLTPTAAALLGFKMDCDGRVLKEMLEGL